jgi:hypothetical protein
MDAPSFSPVEASLYLSKAMMNVLARERAREALKPFLDARYGQEMNGLALAVEVEEEAGSFDLTLSAWEKGLLRCTFPLLRGFKIADWVGMDGYHLATQVAMEWELAKSALNEARQACIALSTGNVVVGRNGETYTVSGCCEFGLFSEEGKDISWVDVVGVFED